MNEKTKFTNINLNQIILDSMPGMAYIFNKEGYMVAWNKKLEEIMGYSAQELKNLYIREYPIESEWENIVAAVNDVYTKGYGQLETTLRTKSGEHLHVYETGSLLEIDGEQYMIGLAINTSELYSARELIKDQMSEISRLNELLQAENVYLKDQLDLSLEHNEIIGVSEATKYILYKIKQVAPTDVSVLIEGETGTGKELIARAIHNESRRKEKQFIKVNCASIPENLIESELFGHEKGAFTGAIEKRLGRFEIANGGTIFLDEIGELPMHLQPKLLHVLQQGEFERIGSSKTIKTDVRVIAATNKILTDEIKKGNFRNDLYYRLNVFPITVTPLRERKEDITPLVEHYVKLYSKKLNKRIEAISKSSLKQLTEYPWPGNVRELENVIERTLISSNDKRLNIDFLPKPENQLNKSLSFEENERAHIIKILEQSKWKINGPNGAAEILKLNPQTLRSKMHKLKIKHK